MNSALVKSRKSTALNLGMIHEDSSRVPPPAAVIYCLFKSPYLGDATSSLGLILGLTDCIRDDDGALRHT